MLHNYQICFRHNTHLKYKMETKDVEMQDEPDLTTLYEFQQRGEITCAHFTIDMLSKLKFKPAPANAFLYFGSIIRRVIILVKINEPIHPIDRYEFSWQLKAIEEKNDSKSILIRFESDSILTNSAQARSCFKVGSLFRFLALPTLEPEFHLLVLSMEPVLPSSPFIEYHETLCNFTDIVLKRVGQDNKKKTIDPSVKQLIRPGTETKTLQKATDEIILDLIKNQGDQLRSDISQLPAFGEFNRKQAFKMTAESKKYYRKKNETKTKSKAKPRPIPSDDVWLMKLMASNI